VVDDLKVLDPNRPIREAADGLAAKLAWQAFIDELRLLGFARALIPLSNIAIFD